MLYLKRGMTWSCPFWLSGCSVAACAAFGRRDAGFVFAGEKCIDREFDAAEDVAGTFGTADTVVFTADFRGDTVVKSRDQQLGIPFQTND